jgi:hypothetical protein
MPAATKKVIRIDPIDMLTLDFKIEGTAPLGISRFSYKAQQEIESRQEAGSTSASRKNREARDFEADYNAARYVSEEGWYGINAAAFRNGMISVCKLTGFVMTRAKLAVFIEADGKDATDQTPLVRIYGEPEMWRAPARNSNGSFDIRCRARWPRWKMRVRVHFDGGVFTDSDVTNLLMRLGIQAGIGEGRHDSKDGPGIGMGTFRLLPSDAELEVAA